MRGKRMFVAIDPSAEAVARATRIAGRLQAEGVEAAWVRPAEMHLTLHFLGDDVDDSDLHRLCLALDEAAAVTPAFRITLRGLGVFPDSRRPRVVWLGVEQGRGELVALHDALARQLTPLGFPPEARGFRPHLTLGRFRSGGTGPPAPALAAAIERCGASAASEMLVRKVVLYESRLTKAGAEHDRLHAAALAGP
ncbi:MAG: RNA 2',3'-cyclic phosphodiesterase [Planctomycetota bacterium]